MATLTDPERLAAYRDALKNWSYSGYVTFQLNETAYKWLKANIGDISLKELGKLMHQYVESGGEIDEVRETREPWVDDYEFHHDLRFEIDGTRIYIETRLVFRPPFQPDDAVVTVVNIHEP